MRQDHITRLMRRGLLFVLVLLATLLPATVAFAGPPDPTLTISELRTRLESGDPLTGYMKTAMKGYAVEQIPVEVQGLVEDAWGTLILFEAGGAAIDRIGGIAAGMSGSPLYVNDGGTHKLVGAVSYGDSFTRGGVGLATPIEYMTAVQEGYAPARTLPAGTYTLREPVETESGTIASVTIARSARAAARIEAPAGQSVMAPLALMEIGGLNPQSQAFKRLAARLESRGVSVRAASGTGAWTGDPAPALEPGSPCVVMFSTGTVWFGGAGTVTYVDGDDVMMFGHPAWWVGPTHASLNAGYVTGVWPSDMTPYKLVAPRDAKGAVVQDRYWGVLGRLGQTPDMFPVTTHASYPDEGRETTDSSSVSQWFVTQPSYSDISASVTMYALTAANDIELYPGSAETTTTVVVSDSTGTYTVRRMNVWDTGDDVATEASYDVQTIMSTLAENRDGLLAPHVQSVDLDATVSPVRRSARFAAVLLPKGLRTGANEVVVRCYPYGSKTIEEYRTTLTLPKGTPTRGMLYIVPGSFGRWYDQYDYDYEPGADLSPPQTLAQVVAALNDSIMNSDLIVSYEPVGKGNGPAEESSSITATIETPYVFSGEFSGETADVRLYTERPTIPYANAVGVAGLVSDTENEVEVDIYRKDVGSSTERYVKTVTAKPREGDAFFTTSVGPLRRNTQIIARTKPTKEYLTGTASARVNVRASVTVGVRDSAGGAVLSVKVWPAAARGRLILERKTASGWIPQKSAAWKGSAVSFSVGGGAQVLRVRAAGLDICAPGVSRTIRLR